MDWNDVISRYPLQLGSIAESELKNKMKAVKERSSRFYGSSDLSAEKRDWALILVDLWLASTSTESLRITSSCINMCYTSDSLVVVEKRLVDERISSGRHCRLFCDRILISIDFPIFAKLFSDNYPTILGIIITNVKDCLVESDFEALKNLLNALVLLNRRCSTDGKLLGANLRELLDKIVIEDGNIPFECKKVASVILVSLFDKEQSLLDFLDCVKDSVITLSIYRALVSTNHPLLLNPKSPEISCRIRNFIKDLCINIALETSVKLIVFEIVCSWLEFCIKMRKDLLDEDFKTNLLALYQQHWNSPIAFVSCKAKNILELLLKTGGSAFGSNIFKQFIVRDDSPFKYKTLAQVVRVLSSEFILVHGSSYFPSILKNLSDDSLAPSITEFYLNIMLKTTDSTSDSHMVIKALADSLLHGTQNVRVYIGERILKTFCRICRDNPKRIKRVIQNISDQIDLSNSNSTHAMVQIVKISSSAGAKNPGFDILSEEKFQGTLLESLKSHDASLRCDTIMLILDSNKPLGDINGFRLDSLKQFIELGSIYEPAPEFRQKIFNSIADFFKRIRLTLDSEKHSTDELHWLVGDFFGCLSKWICKGLYPQAPYYITCAHTTLLSVFLENFQNSNSELIQKIFEKVISNNLFVGLMWLLRNNYSGMRSTVFSILKLIPCERYATVFERSGLVTEALKLMNSRKASESECGAMIIYLFDRQGYAKLDVVLRDISQRLKLEVGVMAIRKPLCEPLRLVQLLIENYSPIDFNSIYSLVQNSTEKVLPILSNPAPEGILIEEDENDDSFRDDIEENLSLAEEGQILLSISWRIIKNCSNILELIIKDIKEDSPVEHMESVSSLIHRMMQTIRHFGAFSAVYPVYCTLCVRLYGMSQSSTRRISGPKLAENWLNGHIEELLSRKISITRRSAGLPLLILSILIGESCSRTNTTASTDGSYCRRPLLLRTMKRLFEIARMPVSPKDIEENAIDLLQVHALNIIRAVLRETRLASETPSFLAPAMILAIDGFQNPCWAIRNCATMLYSSLTIKIFGQTDALGKLSMHKFFVEYPEVYKHVETILRETAKQTDKKFSRLFPALCILARLKPTLQDAGMASNLDVNDLLSKVEQVCRKSRNEKDRLMAASALVPLSVCSHRTPATEIIRLLKELSEMQATHDLNHIQGLLHQLRAMMNFAFPATYVDVEAALGDNPSAGIESLTSTGCQTDSKTRWMDYKIFLDFALPVLQKTLWILLLDCAFLQANYLRMLFDFIIQPNTVFNGPVLEIQSPFWEQLGALLSKMKSDDFCVGSAISEKYRCLIMLCLSKINKVDDCAPMIKHVIDGRSIPYEAQIACLEYLTNNHEHWSLDQARGSILNAMVMNSKLETDQQRMIMKFLFRLFMKAAIRPINEDIANIIAEIALGRNSGLDLQCEALRLFGHITPSFIDCGDIVEQWIHLMEVYSDENQPKPLRLACLNSLMPMAPLLFSQHVNIPKNRAISLILTVISRRLLQDDDDDIRNQCALLISPYLNAGSKKALYIFATVKSIFEYLLNNFGADVELLEAIVEVLVDSDHRLANIQGSNNSNLFNKEKVNINKDEMLDPSMALEVLAELRKFYRSADFNAALKPLFEIHDSIPASNSSNQMRLFRRQLLDAAISLSIQSATINSFNR